jgi:hypothetical protein
MLNGQQVRVTSVERYEEGMQCKVLSSKKIDIRRTLRQVFGPEHHTPPLLTHCTYSHRGGGGELNQRDGERGSRGEYRSHSWVENTNMNECTQEIGYL